MFNRLLVVTALVLLTAGCFTPYQPFELYGRGGYQEKRISEDMYKVTYYGNHATPMETLNLLLLYRSAELATNNGYDYFVVLEERTRLPLSTLGGFRSAEHTIRMYKGEPKAEVPGVYVARVLIQEHGPSIRKLQ